MAEEIDKEQGIQTESRLNYGPVLPQSVASEKFGIDTNTPSEGLQDRTAAKHPAEDVTGRTLFAERPERYHFTDDGVTKFSKQTGLDASEVQGLVDYMFERGLNAK